MPRQTTAAYHAGYLPPFLWEYPEDRIVIHRDAKFLSCKVDGYYPDTFGLYAKRNITIWALSELAEQGGNRDTVCRLVVSRSREPEVGRWFEKYMGYASTLGCTIFVHLWYVRTRPTFPGLPQY